MAVMVPTKVSDSQFSISNIISRFRSTKGFTTHKRKTPSEPLVQHDARSLLGTTPLPLVLPEHQKTLPALGWTTLTFPHTTNETTSRNIDTSVGVVEMNLAVSYPHPLQQAYEDLFAASQTFFNLPDTQKQQWKHKLGSEEGWSKIPGEKEFITLRTLEYCPEILRGPAKLYWDLMGAHISSTLGRISTNLGLPDGEQEGLRQFVGPCGRMQEADADKTATMLRLFRYEGWEAKEVAEPHADLGLMSVVVGSVPGLEVWDGFGWFACEKEVEGAGQKGATLLAGRQLEQLSNGRYPAGGHRVVSYGVPGYTSTSVPEHKHYRFSIVFVLRAHEPVVINSDELETAVTGRWINPLQGVTAGKNYETIRGRHYNINIDMDEREKQRRKVKTLKSEQLPSSG